MTEWPDGVRLDGMGLWPHTDLDEYVDLSVSMGASEEDSRLRAGIIHYALRSSLVVIGDAPGPAWDFFLEKSSGLVPRL